MRWLELQITTTQEASDAICEMLAQIGADGISVSDPCEIKRIIEAPDSLSYADDGYLNTLGTDVVIKGYFGEFEDGIRLGAKETEYGNPEGVGHIYASLATGTCSHDEVKQLLEKMLADIGQYLDIGEGKIETGYVADEDWANNWKSYYEIMHVSPRIIICPSWQTAEPKTGEIVISLDPGSAFGTGSHETTAMCIRLIDKYMEKEKTVLDLGCGSGILSVVAKKLGATHVEAIDIDRMAVEVASENCEINEAEVLCHTGQIADATLAEYDWIVANIVAEVITKITPEAVQKIRPGGHYVVSGIIDTKKDSVEKTCKDCGLQLRESLTENDWWAFLYQKPPHEESIGEKNLLQ